jgi:hypothetical protein
MLDDPPSCSVPAAISGLLLLWLVVMLSCVLRSASGDHGDSGEDSAHLKPWR